MLCAPGHIVNLRTASERDEPATTTTHDADDLTVVQVDACVEQPPATVWAAPLPERCRLALRCHRQCHPRCRPSVSNHAHTARAAAPMPQPKTKATTISSTTRSAVMTPVLRGSRTAGWFAKRARRSLLNPVRQPVPQPLPQPMRQPVPHPLLQPSPQRRCAHWHMPALRQSPCVAVCRRGAAARTGAGRARRNLPQTVGLCVRSMLRPVRAGGPCGQRQSCHR